MFYILYLINFCIGPFQLRLVAMKKEEDLSYVMFLLSKCSLAPPPLWSDRTHIHTHTQTQTSIKWHRTPHQWLITSHSVYSQTDSLTEREYFNMKKKRKRLKIDSRTTELIRQSFFIFQKKTNKNKRNQIKQWVAQISQLLCYSSRLVKNWKEEQHFEDEAKVVSNEDEVKALDIDIDHENKPDPLLLLLFLLLVLVLFFLLSTRRLGLLSFQMNCSCFYLVCRLFFSGPFWMIMVSRKRLKQEELYRTLCG